MASLDASGNLVLQRVKSFSKRKSEDEAYRPAGTGVSVGAGINDPLISSTSTEVLKFQLTMSDGNTREFEIKGQRHQEGVSDPVGAGHSGRRKR